MNEMVTGDVSSSTTSTPAPTDSGSSVHTSTPSERTFKQSEVNDIVGKRVAEERERYARQTSMQTHSQPQQSQPNQSSQGNQNDYLEHVRKAAAEETQRVLNERAQQFHQENEQKNAQRTAQEIFGKIDASKSKYEDFDTVMQDVNLGSFANTAELANRFENTGDILYELVKNPNKLANLEYLFEKDPKMAMTEMKRLSASIKNNEQAANFKSPNEPLSQLRPTNAGAERSGPNSVGDYRRKYKM